MSVEIKTLNLAVAGSSAAVLLNIFDNRDDWSVECLIGCDSQRLKDDWVSLFDLTAPAATDLQPDFNPAATENRTHEERFGRDPKPSAIHILLLNAASNKMNNDY